MNAEKDTRKIRILKNLDALGCSFIADRAKAGEYISTYCWRVRKAWAVNLINRLFKDPHHCRKSFEGQKDALGLVMDDPDCVFCKYSYMNEKNGTQNAPEYRKQFDEESA